VFATAIPTIAATITGNINPLCSLEALSYLEDDATILDEGVIENGSSPEGTQQDPFQVDWFGRVDFRFQTGTTVFSNNRWEIYAMGLPVPILSGSDDNPMDLDEVGFVEIDETAPGVPRFVGLVHVNGWLEGNSGASRCEGEGWVQIVGDPVGTVPWVVMAGLILAGLVFLVATPYTRDWEEGQLTPWEQYVPGERPEN
jgi:hypothetical protein